MYILYIEHISVRKGLSLNLELVQTDSFTYNFMYVLFGTIFCRLASDSVYFETCFSSNIYIPLVPGIIGHDGYGLLAYLWSENFNRRYNWELYFMYEKFTPIILKSPALWILPSGQVSACIHTKRNIIKRPKWIKWFSHLMSITWGPSQETDFMV